MCGIYGSLGQDEAVAAVIDGLHRLEYRGYDSAGVAVLTTDHKLKVIKRVGYVSGLSRLVFRQSQQLRGRVAIGHTRWATHGRVTQANAHPQTDCRRRIAVVHNGVIENYHELKQELESKGHKFSSQTDTEVIAHLIEEYLNQGLNFKQAFKQALSALVGAWAVAVVSPLTPDSLWFGRFSSPLALGLGSGELFISSDAQVFNSYVKRVVFVEDGQLGRLSLSLKKGFELFNLDGRKVDYEVINKGRLGQVRLDKSGFAHFMLKEIWEQPEVIKQALQGRVDFKRKRVVLGGLESVKNQLQTKQYIGLIACGTSYHAALLGRLYGVGLADLPVFCWDSSNFGRLDVNPAVMDQMAAFYISQSGETADTLSTLKLIQARTKALNLGVVNVVGSSLSRAVKAGIYTRAGVEVGVAATKSFTAQVIALLLAQLYLSQLRQKRWQGKHKLFADLNRLPLAVASLLESGDRIKLVADQLSKVKNFMFLGRHLAYPVALEAALKLKEITYRFSYGDKLGSLKHGPLATVGPDNVVVAFVFRHEPEVAKSIANLHEITARGGRLVVITDLNSDKEFKEARAVIRLPQLSGLWLTPILAGVAAQLLAYHLAVKLGREIDKPRYLAKSVTVI